MSIQDERYRDCTFASYDTSERGQSKAVAQCRDYVVHASENFKRGRSILFIGPVGTGKDHLMIATMRAIIRAYKLDDISISPDFTLADRSVRHVDGSRLYERYREAIRGVPTTAQLDELYTSELLHWLAISDPIPAGIAELSEYEQKTLFRIVDARYRARLPMFITANVADRSELESRVGHQVADRLCDDALTVKCYWKSYRQKASL